MFVVCTHPDNGDRPFVDRVPVLDEEVAVLFEYQRRLAFEHLSMLSNDESLRDPLGGTGSEAPTTPLSNAAGEIPNTQEVLAGLEMQLMPEWERTQAFPPAGNAMLEEGERLPGSQGGVRRSRLDDSQASMFDEDEFLAEGQPSQQLPFTPSQGDSKRRRLVKKTSAADATSAASAAATSLPAAEHHQPVSQQPRAVSVGGSSGSGGVATASSSGGPGTVSDLISDLSRRGRSAADAMDSEVTSDGLEIIQNTSDVRKYVKERRGQWPHELQRIAVGALTVYNYRLIDLTMREHVHLLYIIEGEQYLRAHAGQCYMYRNGAFTQFNGVPSQTMLARIKKFFLELEGLFRCIHKDTERTDDELLAAIDKAIDLYGGALVDYVSGMK